MYSVWTSKDTGVHVFPCNTNKMYRSVKFIKKAAAVAGAERSKPVTSWRLRYSEINTELSEAWDLSSRPKGVDYANYFVLTAK